MKKILHIENFGKVKKADVDLQDFVLFVGDNNSGKTYVMQLIYGVFEYITHFRRSSSCKQEYHYTELFQSLKNNQYINNEIFQSYLEYFNECLKNDKDEIIERTFNHKIDIGKLWIEVDLEDLQFEFDFLQDQDLVHYYDNNEFKDSSVFSSEEIFLLVKDRLEKVKNGNEHLIYLSLGLESEKNSPKKMQGFFSLNHKKLDDRDWSFLHHDILGMMISLVFDLSRDNLYLPSSRAGLHLLYKDYFISKGDRNFASQINRLDTDDMDSKLTKPVYDYLRYLQKWELNSKVCEKNKGLLRDFEKKLIEGKYEKENQLEYIPDGTDSHIPMYLTSSMISELIPYYYYITSDIYINANYLMIDEAESCLHPKKQMELVQFLIKLNNDGKKIIMSTHSDSMASKINNMVVLTDKVRSGKKELLEKVHLSYDDLFDGHNIKVYSFSNKGTYSDVKEVEYNPRVGFSFEQFEDSFATLYSEATIAIGEE